MARTLRELKQQRNSVATTMKITKAMELIAAARVTKAQQRARNAEEYTRELVRAVSTVAAYSRSAHRLTHVAAHPKRAAVLVINSDRGLAGGYPSNVMRTAEGLINHLTASDMQIDIYTCGKRAREYFNFRHVDIVQSWQGFSEDPHYENARDIGEVLINRVLTDTNAGGVDEIHVVYTRLISLVSQHTEIIRLLPLEIVRDTTGKVTDVDGDVLKDAGGYVPPPYHFEPNAETVLDALLPLYIIDRLKYMLREAAASELAARQQAMHSATDNAQQLIDTLTRETNTARQAAITQEIAEVVGGASALSQSAQEM